MNTEDPNPKKFTNEELADVGSLLESVLAGLKLSEIIFKVETTDYINIDFFWQQFKRYFEQKWVSIPNQKQFQIRPRNKSPPNKAVKHNKINSEKNSRKIMLF